MKIFVGYGYNPRDAWIEDLAFRLIKAFGDEPTHGKETYGGTLDDEVVQEIRACHAAIGFRTRREFNENTQLWTTHPWVDDELLTIAQLAKRVPFVEVRETRVREPDGLLRERLQGKQFITYDETHCERCVVEIAQALGRWHRQRASIQFTLLPEEFGRTMRPLLRDPDLRCVYRILGESDTEAGPEQKAMIHRLPHGQMIIRTGAVPENASIMVEVWMGQRQLLWNSELQPVDSRTIYLEKAP